MRIRGLLVALAVLAVLGGGIYWSNKVKQAEEGKQNDRGGYQAEDAHRFYFSLRRSVQLEDPGMQGQSLLQRRAERAVQTFLQVQLASVGDHMGEQVAVEGRVLFQEGVEVEGAFRGDEIGKTHLMRWDGAPLLLGVAMVRVGTMVADALEDHRISLPGTLLGRPEARTTRCRAGLARPAAGFGGVMGRYCREQRSTG